MHGDCPRSPFRLKQWRMHIAYLRYFFLVTRSTRTYSSKVKIKQSSHPANNLSLHPSNNIFQLQGYEYPSIHSQIQICLPTEVNNTVKFNAVVFIHNSHAPIWLSAHRLGETGEYREASCCDFSRARNEG